MQATPEQYRQLLQQLLPPGAAWSRELDAVLTKLLTGFADGLSGTHNRAVDLIEESDPRLALEMLTDFERVVGPDTCIDGGLTTLAERRAYVHAKWISRGGQSRAFYIELAAALGYEITITEYRPFTCESDCEDPCCDEPWRFAWTVTAPETTIREFPCDGGCDEPLRTWGNELLECAIDRAKPTHTKCHFSYGGS